MKLFSDNRFITFNKAVLSYSYRYYYYNHVQHIMHNLEKIQKIQLI